jgi:hypothetical protein
MSCCEDRKRILGMVRVECNAVITACKATLKNIYYCRSCRRRKFVDDWLASATKRWQYFWKWFGFSKPTRRDALEDYYFGNASRQMVSKADMDSCAYGEQETQCLRILRAAQCSKNSTMCLSPEGVSICGM